VYRNAEWGIRSLRADTEICGYAFSNGHCIEDWFIWQKQSATGTVAQIEDGMGHHIQVPIWKNTGRAFSVSQLLFPASLNATALPVTVPEQEAPMSIKHGDSP
jgi:hypothetical protein